MPGLFKIKNVEDAEFTLTHPDGAGAVSIDSNNIAKIDAVNAALALKANTADLKEIGVGQTWQDLTASRVAGTTYTNSTGKPIMVSAYTGWSSSNTTYLVVNGVAIQYDGVDQGWAYPKVLGIIPNGARYSITGWFAGKWSELR